MKSGIIIPLSTDEVKQMLTEVVRHEIEKIKVNSNEDEILKVHEVCALLRITKPTVYSYIEKGILSSYTIGTRRFFLKSEIIAKLKEGKLK